MNNLMSRNSSFEFLRLILMLMIVMHHCIVHGLGLVGFSELFDTTINIPDSWIPASMLSNSFLISSVNCFILISGFFGIKPDRKKIYYLLFALIFYTIIFNFIPLAIDKEYKKAIYSLLFLSHSPYWFVIDYLFLMVFAPLINLGFEKLSNNNIKYYLIGLLIISCYFGFVWQNAANSNGYTLLQFILMYSIGRYIRLNKIKIKNSTSILLFIIFSIFSGAIMIATWHYNFEKWIWKMTFYNNPLIVASSIFLFNFFQNLEIRSQIINNLAKSAFGIYLFQSSFLISEYLYNYIKDLALEFQNMELGWLFLILNIIGISLFICIFSLFFDRIRIFIYNMFTVTLKRIRLAGKNGI